MSIFKALSDVLKYFPFVLCLKYASITTSNVTGIKYILFLYVLFLDEDENKRFFFLSFIISLSKNCLMLYLKYLRIIKPLHILCVFWIVVGVQG